MMKQEIFEQAKFLQEKISHLRTKKLQIEHMKERDNDDDFNLARQLAHDSICYAIGRLEADFNAL